MSETQNLTIEPPDTDRIRRGDNNATAEAIDLLWRVLNQEQRDRRNGVRMAVERLDPKALIKSPAADQNNYNTQGSTLLRFEGALAFNLTGLIARTENTIAIVDVLGAGTVTLKHENAGSEAANRIRTQSGGDVAIATGKAVMLIYMSGRWREQKWA